MFIDMTSYCSETS